MISVSLKFVPKGPIDCITFWFSGNGLALEGWLAITWTNDDYGPDIAKLTGPWTFADQKWVGAVKLLCIIMFKISKIRPKSFFGSVKAQTFLQCLMVYAYDFTSNQNLMVLANMNIMLTHEYV